MAEIRDPENTIVMELKDGGRVVIELLADVAPQHAALQLIDPVRCRGITVHEPNMVHDLQLVLDEILLKSSSAFPASTTGL